MNQQNFNREALWEVMEGWEYEAIQGLGQIRRELEKCWFGQASDGFLLKMEQLQQHMQETGRGLQEIFMEDSEGENYVKSPKK